MLWRVVRDHLGPYMGVVLVVVATQIVGAIASMVLPALNADIINNGVVKADTGHIVGVSWVMLLWGGIQALMAIVGTWAAARVATGVAADLRRDVFGHIMTFSAREHAHFGPATLITRCTNDVQQVQQVTFMCLGMLLMAPITMAAGLFMAIREDIGLSWLVAVSVPVLILSVLLCMQKMIPLFRVMQSKIDAVNRVLREQLTGLRVVRAFVREPYEKQRFAVANDEYTAVQRGVGNIMALIFPIVMATLNFSTVAVIWFGAHRIADGNMQIGSLFAYISYLIQILMSVMMGIMVSTMLPRAAVCAGRLHEVMQVSSSVVVPASPVEPTGEVPPGTVTVRDVEFAYPGAHEPVLAGVSFTASPGTVTAIVGSTGAGKTTLLNLIARLVDVTGGVVEVDGVDVRQLAPSRLWGSVGVVPQRGYLFSGTIASNLRYGNPDATDEQLWEALRIAQAEDFVRAKEGGLEAPVDQGGSNVSGGQRQRLCIARALVAQPSIYLFDDSFSALDLTTDARLRAALKPVTSSATVIIVAQRLSTIADAHQIVVLDDGRVVGVGRHTELLATNPIYAAIAASQHAVEDVA